MKPHPPAPSTRPPHTSLPCSVVAAKTHARSLQQRYPLHAKQHALSGIKVLLWLVFWGGIEVGIQFANLIFARQSTVRNVCVVPHTGMGLLLYYAPVVVKVSGWRDGNGVEGERQ
jgi:hypothetical protein